MMQQQQLQQQGLAVQVAGRAMHVCKGIVAGAALPVVLLRCFQPLIDF
jgi:hypothetical protein